MKYDLNLNGRKRLSSLVTPLTILACMTFSLSAFSAGGSNGDGTASGGGGVTVDISQHPALRDLVDKTVCNWVGASDFQKKYAPDSQMTIDKVKAAHWYLGDAYEREINRLKVCMTEGPLKDVNVTDPDSVTVYPPPGEKIVQKQIAIRLNEMIFVDMSLFLKMNKPTHKDFLFIHEVTHSFLPLNVPRRNDSLRSFIFMLSQGFDAKTLALNIEANHIDMPKTSVDINHEKQNLLKVFAVDTGYLERVILARKLDYIKKKLWSGDVEYLAKIRAQYRKFNYDLHEAIASENIESIKALYFVNNIKFEEKVDLYDPNDNARRERSPEGHDWYYYDNKNGAKDGLAWAFYITPYSYKTQRFPNKSIYFFMDEAHLTPRLQDLKIIVETINYTDHYKFLDFRWFTNPMYIDLQRFAQIVVDHIPNNQLQVFAQDPTLKSCSAIADIISNKLKSK